MPDFSDPNFDFEEAQRALDRRRKNIQAMLAAPAVDSGYKGRHWVNPYPAQLTKSIIEAAGQYDLRDAERQGEELATAKNAELSKWLMSRPEDTPEQQEVIGTGPIAPPPGTPGVDESGGGMDPMNTAEPGVGAGPSQFSAAPRDTPAVWMGDKTMDMVPKGAQFTPNQASRPMIPAPLSKVAEWAGGGNRFGGQMDDFARKSLEYSVTQPERSRLAREAAAERARLAEAALQERRDRTQSEQTLRRDLAGNAETARRDLAQQLENMRRDLALLGLDAKYDLAKAVGAVGAGGSGSFTDAGSSLDGNPVRINNKTNESVEIKDGKAVPYTGPIVAKGEEKDVKAAMGAENDARMAQRLAELVKADTKAFGPRANFGTSVANMFGGLGKEKLSGLTPDQLELRGVIGRDFAKTTKDLYGASFTASEQQRAAGFTPTSQDSAESVIQKLEGAARFSREMAEKYGTKAQQAAMRRLGGNTRSKYGI